MPTDSLISLLGNLWSIFLIVLFFGGSVFVHELGHFLAARRRGLKVERFSIGFGPALWSRRGKDGVEYRVSALPLGGYVMLPQLADLGPIEGESDSDMTKLPPISYTTKMIVLVAGAFFNVLLAFFLASVLWLVGQPVVEEEQTTRVGFVRKNIELPDGKLADGPAYLAKIQQGDIILAVDGNSVKSLNDIAQLVALGGGRTSTDEPKVVIEFERDGQRMSATILPVLVGPEAIRDIGIEPSAKVTVMKVLPGSAAEAAGLEVKDVITQVDGHEVGYVSFISDYLREHGAKAAHVTFLRQGKVSETTVTPRVVVDPQTKLSVYRMGVELGGAYTTKTIHPTPWTQVWDKVIWTKRSIFSLLNRSSNIGVTKLSTPIGMAYRVHQLAQTDIRLVLWFSILVNVNLAILNLLPFPILDGGQMVFATIAKLRGRQLPVNFLATAQIAFMILLLSMALYVGFHDVLLINRDMKEDAQAREAAAERKKTSEHPAPAKP